MIVRTLFRHNSRFEPGEIEIKLLPGVPLLHVVGLPDASLREAGIKLKSALRSCGLKWPLGQQIVVNLRPAHLRKQSGGAELAIALGVLGATDQLSGALRAALANGVVYGEIALDGRVFAPPDVGRAVRATNGRTLLTGAVAGDAIRDGEWLELHDLAFAGYERKRRAFDWNAHWSRPELPDLEFPETAARQLALAVHARLHVLVAGPQGTGKSTWARALYALTPPPDLSVTFERADMLGEDALDQRWRPCERPHHTLTTQAMVGGGRPLQPGVISRAHGGVLILDEFLEFPAGVLEALREPIESGYIELARNGERERLPAEFQMVATTNLCPCGKLDPRAKAPSCAHSLLRCRSVCLRLGGPLADRFDMVVLSHDWMERRQRRVHLREVRAMVEAMGEPSAAAGIPEWIDDGEWSYRRKTASAKVARALARLEGRDRVLPVDCMQAQNLTKLPLESLRRLFG